MPKSWLHSQSTAAGWKSQEDDPGSYFPLPTPLSFVSTYKSLPSLSNSDQEDKVDRKVFHHESISMDTLYRGEDAEIDFLDTFLDYDSISLTNPDNEKSEEKYSEGFVGSWKEEKRDKEKPRRRQFKDRLRWLTSQGKLSLRNLGGSRSLSSIQIGLKRGKERLGQIQKEVNKSREKLHWSVRKQGNHQLSSGGQDEEKSVGGISRIQSYQIPVYSVRSDPCQSGEAVTQLERLEKVVAKDSVREVLSRKKEMEPIQEEQDLAFNNLVYTEMDFKDQPREKESSPYENVCSGEMYENVTNIITETPVIYQNIETTSCKELNVDGNCYENIVTTCPQSKSDDHYEHFDFGETGIYQNIIVQGQKHMYNNDIYSQVKHLKEAVYEVNNILSEDSNQHHLHDSTENKTKQRYISENITKNQNASIPSIESEVTSGFATYNVPAGDNSHLYSPDEASLHKNSIITFNSSIPTSHASISTCNSSNSTYHITISTSHSSSSTCNSSISTSNLSIPTSPSTIPISHPSIPTSCSTPVSGPNSTFQRWALGKTEQPMINLENMSTLKSENSGQTTFSDTEREIVAKFLESMKTEFSQE